MDAWHPQRLALVDTAQSSVRYTGAQDRGMKSARWLVIVGERAGAAQEAEILRPLDFLANQGVEWSAHPAFLTFCR